ncbi:MAG: hypothetical protein QXP36_12690 [Conexivisphaerales archaeon]
MLMEEMAKRFWRFAKSPYVLPPLFLVGIFYFFYRNLLVPNLIIVGDLGIPYPSPLLYQLSSTTPWYGLLSSFIYENFYSIYGYLFNSLQIFLFIPSYFSMYFLLAEMKVKRAPAILFSVFYLLNPVVFPNVFTYSNLMWSEFYLFAPLLLLFLFRYHNTTNIRYLIIVSVLLSLYLEIQTAPTLFNIRLILPIIGLPYLYVLINKLDHEGDRKRILRDNLFSIVVLVGLNFFPILQTLGFYSSITGASINVLSGFEGLHYNNVVYTYQSQNLIFAISGLVVYPNFRNSLLMGYGQPFFIFTLIFDCIIAISVVAQLFSTRKDSGFIKSMAVSILIIWIFISLVQSGILLPLFKRFSILYLWEYPSYLEMALFVLYPILLAAFLSKNCPQNSSFETKFNISGVAKRVHCSLRTNSRWRSLIPIVLVLLIFTYFTPVIYSSPSGFSAIPQYDTQQPFYYIIYTFFKGKGSEYKVMILPFNQTIYKELGSAVPDSQIFALPYAYQNNPSAYPNVSLFNSIYYDFNNNEMSNFINLLNYTGVEYLVVLTGAVTSSQIQSLRSLPCMSEALKTSNFIIFRYDYFSPVKFEEPRGNLFVVAFNIVSITVMIALLIALLIRPPLRRRN